MAHPGGIGHRRDGIVRPHWVVPPTSVAAGGRAKEWAAAGRWVRGMGDFLFGRTVGMLKNAMDGAGAAHGAIANNIANVNTPNFRRTDVSFKDALAATDASAPAGGELPLVTTSDRDIPAGGAQDAAAFKITTTVDETQQMRLDGSNVDVDQEMAKLSLNSSYAQTMSQLLQTQYTTIKASIEEHF
jgi:flagellar basal-body rod protein FlgB